MVTITRQRRQRSAPIAGADEAATGPTPQPPVEPIVDPTLPDTLAEDTGARKTPRRTQRGATSVEDTAAATRRARRRASGTPPSELGPGAPDDRHREAAGANARSRSAGPGRRSLADGIAGLATVGLAVGALLLAVTVLGTPSDRPAVASPDRTSIAAGQWRSVEETFDELPMDSKLPKPWSVSGAARAAVVALPTSVDRSVRISSAVDGRATSACRPVALVLGGNARIAVDYLVGRLPPAPAVIVSFDSATARQLAFGVDQSGASIAIDASGSVISPSGGASTVPAAVTSGGDALWQRLEVTIDQATGIVQWQAHDSSGTETGSGETQVQNAANGAFDRICLLSPQGVPSGWVAIDDLVVEG